MWMTGDSGQIAPLIQGEADGFVARLELKPDMRVLDVSPLFADSNCRR